MTRDDIIRMAREAGFVEDDFGTLYEADVDELERFAALVAAAEREACAQMAEDHAIGIHGHDKHGYADAIREREEK